MSPRGSTTLEPSSDSEAQLTAHPHVLIHVVLRGCFLTLGRRVEHVAFRTS